MSKNLTRKGLAFGALVALGSSVIAGAPANAAPGLTLTDLNAKGNYGMIEQQAFTLLASGNSEFPTGSTASLRVLVKNVSGSTAAPTVEIGATTASVGAPTAKTYVDNTTSAATTTAVGTTAGDKAVFAMNTPTSAFVLKITSGAVAADKTEKFEVTVFADTNNNGVVDGELSATQTVTFSDLALVKPSITIDAPVQGALTVGADVAIPGIAVDQLVAADYGVLFTDGVDAQLGTATNATDAVTLSTDKTKLESDLTINAGLAKDSAVKAQLVYKSGGVVATWSGRAGNTKIGDAATASVTAAKVALFTAGVVRSATAKDDVVGTSAAVKRNSTFEFKAVATDSSSPAKKVAGVPVEITISTDQALSATGTVVSLAVNGTVYTDATKLPGTATTGDAVVKTVTDADGVAKVTITTVGFAAGKTVTAAFKAEALTATVYGTQTDAVYSTNSKILSHDLGATTTDGVAVPVVVSVVDQWGGVPADGKFDARAIFVSSDQTTAATDASNVVGVAVAGGKATLNILDNGTGTGTNRYSIQVIEKDATNGGYGSNVAQVINATFDIKIVSAANATAGTIKAYTSNNGSTEQAKNSAETAYAYDVSGSQALSVADFGAYDSFANTGTEPTQTVAGVALYGQVTTAASATAAATAIAGSSVTLAGAGLQFKATLDNGRVIWAVDSITVPTDATGFYNVVVWSHKAGTQTVVITSGAAKATAEVKFAAALTGAGTSLVVTAPASIAAGRTLEVSALLTDKYGNGVVADATHTSIAYDGPGLVVGTLPTTFDADGKAKFRVLLGASDQGTATVTFKYSDSDADFTDTTDIVKTATVTVGAAPVAVEPTSKIGTANSRVYVNVKDAKGSVVSVKIGAKWFTRSALNNDYTLSFKAVAKKKVSVKVYVDGDLSSSKTIIVKK